MRVAVVDVETTIRGGSTFGSSPYFAENNLVLLGIYDGESDEAEIYGTPSGMVKAIKDLTSSPVLLIGHNITYDLQWLLRIAESGIDLRNITIWDTQQAEYLLSGQSHLYPSLNDCCSAMGLPLKDDKIAQYWKDGVDTEDIPASELRDYLRHDLSVTWRLFLYQQEIFSHLPELRKLAEIKMEDILYTTTMVWNGMRFDLDTADKRSIVINLQLSAIEAKWVRTMGDLFASEKIPGEWLPRITSNKDVGTLLFGGDCSWIEQAPTGIKYKTGLRAGEEKTVAVKRTCTVAGLEPAWAHAVSTKTGWKVDDETLSLLAKVATNPTAAALANDVLLHRALQKELSTYILGYSSMVSNRTGLIHPTLNHCSTATGRLSCVKPNLQNVSGVEN